MSANIPGLISDATPYKGSDHLFVDVPLLWKLLFPPTARLIQVTYLDYKKLTLLC